MDCCSVNGLDKIFNKSKAQKESKAYLKKGLGKRARKIVDFLKSTSLSGATVLDIGCGIGALHFELLKEGAAKAVGVDVSPASMEAATSLAQRVGFQGLVEYHVGDFVEQEGDIGQADIVLLDRVICCYPDMERLVTTSAQHAHRLYVLTYPTPTWWLRTARLLLNLGLTIFRNRYRFFLHHPSKIAEILASEGFTNIFHTTSTFGFWQVAVYQRQ